MGLVNIEHAQLTQSMIDLQSDLLKNPFYLFNDKKGIPVDYYNLNTTRTTLDPALKTAYAEHGEDTPLRFNLVHDLYIYGLDRIATNLENGDFGINSEVTGDAIILPGTIQPYVGDNFVITMVKGRRYLFQVTSVTSDTFENGGNYWRIEYALDHLDDHELESAVVDEFKFVSGNVGTNYSPVLLKSKYDVCKALDDCAVNLKNVYRGLYFNNKVQTFTYVFLGQIANQSMNTAYFYDPYSIEFIIKNKVLANSGGKYEFVDHKTNLRPEFPIVYSHSIWKCIELREMNDLMSCRSSSSATYIDDPGTIFASRYEPYFELTYAEYDPSIEPFAPAVDILPTQVIGHIMENQLFDQDSANAKYNVLIKYFNHTDIGVEDIVPFERILENQKNGENYFLIPMAIYVMEVYIKELMARGKQEGELSNN